MPKLNAPSWTIFLLSMILVIIAWIGVFAHLPYLGEHPSVVVAIAFAYLAAGCLPGNLGGTTSSEDGVRKE